MCNGWTHRKWKELWNYHLLHNDIFATQVFQGRPSRTNSKFLVISEFTGVKFKCLNSFFTKKRETIKFLPFTIKIYFFPCSFLSFPPLRKKNCPFSQPKLNFPSILWDLLPRDFLFRVIPVLLLISLWLLNIIT